ncbi:MAG: hypothetical protein M3454_05240 [Actinomycetota bacterium]|nr:hypothetical protein [Actinomycetota bacterium]
MPIIVSDPFIERTARHFPALLRGAAACRDVAGIGSQPEEAPTTPALNTYD